MPLEASEVSAVGQNGSSPPPSGGGAPSGGMPSFQSIANSNGAQGGVSPGVSQPVNQPQSGGSAAQQQAFSLRQALVGSGIPDQQWSDDGAAYTWLQSEIQKLASNYQKAQEMARYGQSGQYFEANRAEFEQAMAAYRASKAQQTQTQQVPGSQAETKPKFEWNPPEWDNSWAQHLEVRDGQVVPKPFRDAGLVGKYEAYQQWRQDALDRVLRKPVETLAPGFEPIIEQIATRIAEEKIAAFQQQQFAQSFVENAKSWMFSDQIAPDGSQQLNEMGQFFRDQFQRLTPIVPDVKMRTELAQKLVEAEFLTRKFNALNTSPDPNAQVQQGQPVPQSAVQPAAETVNEKLKRAAVAPGGTRTPSRGGSVPALAERMKGNASLVDWANAALEDAKAGR